MQKHTVIEGQILSYYKDKISQSSHQLAISHHESWDGTGHPHGLSKKKIPIMGRIIAVVDIFITLISKRPYKGAYTVKHAINIIKKECKKRLDPNITDIFLANIHEISLISQTKEHSIDNTSSFIWSERDIANNFTF